VEELLVLTTRVIPDDMTSPKAATIAKISASNAMIKLSKHPLLELICRLTSPEHALVDVLMALDAIDAEQEERNDH
jgi:hypothetical protein